MDEHERNDLLIRIDTRVMKIEERLEKIEARLSARLCYTHDEKINTLEKITWTALLCAIGSITTMIFR